MWFRNELSSLAEVSLYKIVVFGEVYILFRFNVSVRADKMSVFHYTTPHRIVSLSLSLFLSPCLNFSLQGFYNIGNCDNS